MNKRNTIIYWIATLWLALGMVSTGIVQILQIDVETIYIEKLGYPAYFLIILGVWKILGVLAILAPKFPLLKEWAYAGFFFIMSGGIVSHIIVGDPIVDMLPATLLLALTVVSWYFRPASRKLQIQ